MGRGAQGGQGDLDAPLGRSSDDCHPDAPAACLGLEDGYIVQGHFRAADRTLTQTIRLTPDVVCNPPGNRGVVHGLVDPAQVGLSAF